MEPAKLTPRQCAANRVQVLRRLADKLASQLGKIPQDIKPVGAQERMKVVGVILNDLLDASRRLATILDEIHASAR